MGNAIVARESRDTLLTTLAAKYNLEPDKFFATIKATCKLQDAKDEQVIAFLMVAQKYELDPIVREIYAFEKAGAIIPIVGIDGWLNMVNRHPMYDGMDFNDHVGRNNELLAITCRIHRKDRTKPIEITEYMNECRMNKDTWDKWPARMLRHKALIQCARYAFSFSGIFDPDEGARIQQASTPEEIEQLLANHREEVEIPPLVAGMQAGVAPRVAAHEGFPPSPQSAPDYGQQEHTVEPSDWQYRLETLLIGVRKGTSLAALEKFLDENEPTISELSLYAPKEIVTKWMKEVNDTREALKSRPLL